MIMIFDGKKYANYLFLTNPMYALRRRQKNFRFEIDRIAVVLYGEGT